jgi:hypothetical protein
MMPDHFIKTFRMAPSQMQKEYVQEVVLQLRSEHRTNQASVIRTMKDIITEFAKSNPGTDPRNQDAVEWANEVSKIEKFISYT